MATPTSDIPAPAPAPSGEETSDPVAQTIALLQPWIDYVPQRQRRLGLFIFLAFLAHFAFFFFIRIDTTRAELRRQTRTHVTVESADLTSLTGPAPGDDFWDRLTDPRLFLLPLEPMASLAADEPALDFNDLSSNLGSKQMPPAAPPEDFRFASPAIAPLNQQVGETLHPPRQPFVYEETPPAIAAKTTWQWDAALDARHPAPPPELPSPISDTNLIPTQLQVAINPDGLIEHVLVEQSCGSGRLDLDQQAIDAARKIRFQPTDQSGLLWGRITVYWHYSSKPREEVVPTPPSGP